MKKLLYSTFIISLILQSCFVYDNTISWEDASNIRSNNSDKPSFNMSLDLQSSNRFIYLPFVFCEIHKKKPFYSPEISMTSRDQSIIKFFDFKLDILTLDGNYIFKKHYSDTVILNVFNDNKYNAQLYSYKVDYIPEIKEGMDTVLFNFSIKTVNNEGIINTIEKKNIKYARTHYKKFGSFF